MYVQTCVQEKRLPWMQVKRKLTSQGGECMCQNGCSEGDPQKPDMVRFYSPVHKTNEYREGRWRRDMCFVSRATSLFLLVYLGCSKGRWRGSAEGVCIIILSPVYEANNTVKEGKEEACVTSHGWRVRPWGGIECRKWVDRQCRGGVYSFTCIKGTNTRRGKKKKKVKQRDLPCVSKWCASSNLLAPLRDSLRVFCMH